jgi:uncharacterized damage-inducible protein DinB
MDPHIASQSQLLAIQTSLVTRALSVLTEEETWTRPAESVNSVGWLIGHITWARNGLLACLGGEPESVPGAKLFERGAQLADRSAYPETGAILETMKTVNGKLKARMESITDAELAAPSTVPSPAPDKTVRGTTAFLVFHDAYHVGQIGYAVKLLGKAGLVG